MTNVFNERKFEMILKKASVSCVTISLFFLLVLLSINARAQTFNWNEIEGSGLNFDNNSITFYDEEGHYSIVLNDKDLSGQLGTGYDSAQIIDLATNEVLASQNYPDGTQGPGLANILKDLLDEAEPSPPTEPSPVEITAQESLKTAVSKISSMISSRSNSIISPHRSSQSNRTAGIDGESRKTGLSAGDRYNEYHNYEYQDNDYRKNGFGVWVNGSYTETENDQSGSNWDSSLIIGLLGVDYLINPRFIIGSAFGVEATHEDTDFNKGEVDSNGITICPYLGFLINDWIGLDFSGGYSIIDIDQERNNGNVKSKFDSSKWFMSSNVNTYYSLQNFNLTGTLGYTFASESQDGYRESDGNPNAANDIDLGTISLGGEIGYIINDGYEGYVTLSYDYDTTYEEVPWQDYDRDSFSTGLGLRAQIPTGWMFDVSLSNVFGKEDQDEYTFMANLRYAF